MTIKEVSEKYDISADTLRYYERIGMIPEVTRNANGIRNYQESDLGWVELAICMRSAGLPVEVLIEYVKLFQIGDSTFEARMAIRLLPQDFSFCRNSGKNWKSRKHSCRRQWTNWIIRYQDMKKLLKPEN